jgi:hypothetical protein
MYLRRRNRPFDPSVELSSSAVWAQPDSRWMQVSRYHGQLARYYERFPREQIHVLLTGDLKRDVHGTVQSLYRFVGVDPAFVPDVDTPHNVGGTPASPWLERMFTSPTLRSALEPWVPKQAANWLRRLRTKTMRPAPALPAELKATLTAPFRKDILQTSELIGRNLDPWL